MPGGRKGGSSARRRGPSAASKRVKAKSGSSAAAKRVKAKSGSSAAAKRVKANHKKGAAFEKKVAKAVKRSSGIKTSSVKTQVSTKRHGRADVVAKTKSGKKIVIEAKNFHRNPVTKANVKQVCRYGKDLHAKPKLVVSKSTKVPASTKKFAAQRGVPIMKL